MPIQLLQTIYMQILADMVILHRAKHSLGAAWSLCDDCHAYHDMFGYHEMLDHLETMFQIDLLERGRIGMKEELLELESYLICREEGRAYVQSSRG